MGQPTINLTEARINAGFSVKGLADHLNVSPSVVRAAEVGGSPRVTNKKLLADFFEVRVTDIWPLGDES